MKNFFPFLIVLIIFLGLGCKNTENYDTIIANVNLIDGTGSPLQTEVALGIRNGKISKIGLDENANADSLIDGTGKYLIPGLFDCHIHTTDYQKDFPKFVHYGVTSILITGGSLCTDEYYTEMRNQGNQHSIPAPYVFHTSQHFSMEGRHPSKTYTSNDWRDRESIFFLSDTLQIEKLVKRVAQNPIVGIKLTIEDGPSPPFVERIPEEFISKTVKEASKYGLEVFAHVSDNIELEMAIRGGVQNLVHYTGLSIDQQDTIQSALLSSFKERDPSWVTTLMLDKSFMYPLHKEWFAIEHMIADYQNQINEVSAWSIQRANIYTKLIKQDFGLEEVTLSSVMAPQVEDIKYLADTGFNMVLGTDTGNQFIFPGYALHEEMQLLELGGMSPLEIIKMGTLNAAVMLNAQDSLGSIEEGKIANMILLDKNPVESIKNTLEINKVFKNGIVQQRIEE